MKRDSSCDEARVAPTCDGGDGEDALSHDGVRLAMGWLAKPLCTLCTELQKCPMHPSCTPN
ncbi:hypothetical protein L484_013978 [Morus notabilis]|uniref:Uncharacterized protein n=1 Tax=Morus notabilis TaxID=981085 RepID=W9QU55_9ROSA|nr:hypothetical protein L484_013978 [Morus notabilis]